MQLAPRKMGHDSNSRSRYAFGAAQGLILAAGRGSRLEWETDTRPKCLLEIGGQRLLDHQLDVLREAGINDVVVVAGYLADQVEGALRGRARVVRNPDWADTNSLYSLGLCRDRIRGPVVVLNCDVLFSSGVLAAILELEESAFAYDSSSGADAEHMKVELRGSLLAAMSKRLEPSRVHGENVGLMRFDVSALPVLFQNVDAVLAAGGRRAWLAEAVQRTAQRVPLIGVDVRGLPWIEIDFPEDLTRARKETWPALCDQARNPEWMLASAAGAGS